jgi:hypothetical protein
VKLSWFPKQRTQQQSIIKRSMPPTCSITTTLCTQRADSAAKRCWLFGPSRHGPPFSPCIHDLPLSRHGSGVAGLMAGHLADLIAAASFALLRLPTVGRAIVLFLCLAAAPLHAQQEWSPSNLLLDVIRRIESADGLLTVGDQGRSLGPYQLSAGAWLDVTTWRIARGLPTFDYAGNVFSEKICRGYAADYLRILHMRLAKRLKRTPSSADVYAAYNMGLTAFARSQFELAKVNSVTAANCRRIAAATQAN